MLRHQAAPRFAASLAAGRRFRTWRDSFRSRVLLTASSSAIFSSSSRCAFQGQLVRPGQAWRSRRPVQVCSQRESVVDLAKKEMTPKFRLMDHPCMIMYVIYAYIDPLKPPQCSIGKHKYNIVYKQAVHRSQLGIPMGKAGIPPDRWWFLVSPCYSRQSRSTGCRTWRKSSVPISIHSPWMRRATPPRLVTPGIFSCASRPALLKHEENPINEPCVGRDGPPDVYS